MRVRCLTLPLTQVSKNTPALRALLFVPKEVNFTISPPLWDVGTYCLYLSSARISNGRFDHANNVGRIHSLSYTIHDITNFRAFVRAFFLLFLNKGGTLVDVFWHNCKQIHLSVTLLLFSYLYNFKISLLICIICFINDVFTRHAREISVNLLYLSRSFIATLSVVKG